MHITLLALAPGFAVFTWHFGMGVLLNVAVASLTAVICEALALKLRSRPLDSLADGTVGSLVHAAEALVGNGFVWGGAGTLRVSEALTRAVKKCRVKQVGYCGLMLPVLEDRGLAARCAQGMSSVQSLLACSAVCGVGLDTVPLSGLVSEEALANTYLDVAALAHRLHKPLSCRLFPVPGAKAGEAVAFPDNPYLCDSCALALP